LVRTEFESATSETKHDLHLFDFSPALVPQYVICCPPMGHGKGGKKKHNKIAALVFTVIFSLAIYSSNLVFLSSASVFFLMIFISCNCICFILYSIQMVFTIKK